MEYSTKGREVAVSREAVADVTIRRRQANSSNESSNVTDNVALKVWPEPTDRRDSPRRPAVENRAMVGWSLSDQLTTTMAQVMDVSGCGLLVLADEEPSGDGHVLVRLVEPTATEWVETTLIESRRTRFGPYQLRLAFRETSVGGLLKALTAHAGRVN